MARKPYDQKELDANLVTYKRVKKRLSKDNKLADGLKTFFKECTNGKPGQLVASDGKTAVSLVEKSRDGYAVKACSFLEINIDKTA